MLYGIDISTFQGQPDYSQLKLAKDFVIIRSTYGVGYTDDQFGYNAEQARGCGMKCGFYHFAYPATNTPEAEANWFIKMINEIGGLRTGEMLFLDYEVDGYPDAGDWSFRFLETVKNAFNGYKGMVYTNLDFIARYDWGKVQRGDYGLWLAHWDGNPDIYEQTGWSTVAFKQYTDSLIVPGINGKVDGNSFNGDDNTWKAYGYKGVTPPIPPTPEPKVTIEFNIVIDGKIVVTLGGLQQAQKAFESQSGVLTQGKKLTLEKVTTRGDTTSLEILSSFTKPMEEPVTIETLSTRIQNTFSYALPVQTISAGLGVLIKYYNPGMPYEIVATYTALIAIGLNLAYGAFRYLASKYIK